jgi:hypothetical protein
MKAGAGDPIYFTIVYSRSSIKKINHRGCLPREMRIPAHGIRYGEIWEDMGLYTHKIQNKYKGNE